MKVIVTAKTEARARGRRHASDCSVATCIRRKHNPPLKQPFSRQQCRLRVRTSRGRAPKEAQRWQYKEESGAHQRDTQTVSPT
jgi:hypothetical protein